MRWLRSKLSSIPNAKWSPKLFETNVNLDLHNKESFLWENGVTHWPQSLVNSTYNHKTLCSWFSLPPAYLPTFNARLVEIERGLAGRTTTGWLINIWHFCEGNFSFQSLECKWTDLPLKGNTIALIPSAWL